MPRVREILVAHLRKYGAEYDVVMEGRDIGTVIFPDAEFKFFLSADIEVRARRRFEELQEKGASITFDEVLAQLIERDRRDRARELAPLKQADDAIAIDATNLSADDVVAAIKNKIDAIINGGKDLKRA
jgi:cytidylate kinase